MFIVFDGVDGTGKSTQLEKCRQWLESAGHPVTTCRDPGSTELGDRLRQILLEGTELNIDMRSEMFLFMAARAQLVAEVILPAIEHGHIVLCDRFLTSTIVYQGHAGPLDPEAIRSIGKTATQDRRPDCSLIFDAPLHVAMKRIGTQPDRLESRGEEYFVSVRRGFLSEAALDDSIEVIDASGTPEEIHELVKQSIERRLSGLPTSGATE